MLLLEPTITSNSVLILGISDIEHDTAAAMFEDDTAVAAIQEDVLSRSPSAGGVPWQAIDRCLTESRAAKGELCAVAMASRPKRAWLRDEGGHLTAFISPLGASASRIDSRDHLFRKLDQLRLLRRSFGPEVRLLNFEHHLCHAATAFYPSQFDRALILTLDQCGDMWSGLLALGEGSNVNVLRAIRFPNSLGWFYSRVTELLGFRAGREEHKVQWLSKEGTPEFTPVFRRLFSKNSQCLPVLDLESCVNSQSPRAAFSPQVMRDLQMGDGSEIPAHPLRAAIARSAQEFLEETVVDLAESYRKKTNTGFLCVAGGVFQNVLLVHALEKQTGFARIEVSPVAGNTGSALGSAYLASKSSGAGLERRPLPHLFLGPQFEESQIKEVLDNCKTIYRYLPDEGKLIDETVNLLTQDHIVAWYQGKLEFGHRALGNRSILASPFSQYVMENLNQFVKHREDFHPFGLAVPSEDAAAYFDCSPNCRFMASVGSLKDSSKDFQRFAFNRGTVRVHTVEKEVNPRFWRLLRKFGERSHAPVLVNTSFNLFGEPLVCEPRDAIRSFYCSGIDALVMGNFLIAKP